MGLVPCVLWDAFLAFLFLIYVSFTYFFLKRCGVGEQFILGMSFWLLTLFLGCLFSLFSFFLLYLFGGLHGFPFLFRKFLFTTHHAHKCTNAAPTSKQTYTQTHTLLFAPFLKTRSFFAKDASSFD